MEEVGDDVLDQGTETYARPLVAFYRGDLSTAEKLWSDATRHHEQAGNVWSKATFDFWLGKLHRLRSNAPMAEMRLRSLLEVGERGPRLPLAVWAGCELALLYLDQERIADAAVLAGRCRAIVANGEDWRGLAGRVALADGTVAAEAESTNAAAQGSSGSSVSVRRIPPLRRCRLTGSPSASSKCCAWSCAA